VTDETLMRWVIAWLPMLAILLFSASRKSASAGLVFAYALQLVILHWFAAVIYLLPWYSNLDLNVVFAGLQQSTYAFAGFTLGSVAISPLLMRHRDAESDPSGAVLADRGLIRTCLGMGIVSYFVLTPIVGTTPTVSAIVAAAASGVVVGLALGCWNGSHTRRGAKLWMWGAATTVAPFVTIAVQGFLGYGLAAALIVFTFVASYHQPRWKVLVFGVAAGYLGLSVYVTYMRDRDDIRQVVWGGESAKARLARLADTFSRPEGFSVWDAEHLQRIDVRLNQNYLVGASVLYLQARPDLFAHGETVFDAILAPIPRILWPNKPMVAGSGDLVSRFTGMSFAEGTAVGIGQVMELYVNFGGLGVFLGFIVVGAALGFVDRNAACCRDRGDWSTFLLWFFPGISVLQVGGSLVEVTSSAAAALVVALLVVRSRTAPHQTLGSQIAMRGQAARVLRSRVSVSTTIAPEP
jgi:hypothetical protein